LSAVHFIESHPLKNRIQGVKRLLRESGILSSVRKGSLVAIKTHIGEIGNPYHVDSLIMRTVVQSIQEAGGDPFITDTCSYYVYARHSALSHYRTAVLHGFGYEAMGAPFIVADGLGNSPGIRLKGKGMLGEVSMAEIFFECDFLFVLSHCKGHSMTGFGGALKNVGMGCTTKRSKLEQHRVVGYELDASRCIGCGRCTEVCPWHFPRIVDKKAINDSPGCMRCPICQDHCPEKAIRLQGVENLQKAVASAASTILEGFEGRRAFLSVATNISRYCDCFDSPGEIVTRDIGYFASIDPVAIDSAFLDRAGAGTFTSLHGIDPRVMAEEAEALGLGSRTYELVTLGDGK
jgi:uncharacterized protein